MTTLDSLLQARRTMEHCAMNFPEDIFEMAKADYEQKLKNYIDEKGDLPSAERFAASEAKRISQLTLFNNSGSIHDSSGNNEKVRKGSADSRPAAKSSI